MELPTTLEISKDQNNEFKNIQNHWKLYFNYSFIQPLLIIYSSSEKFIAGPSQYRMRQNLLKIIIKAIKDFNFLAFALINSKF